MSPNLFDPSLFEEPLITTPHKDLNGYLTITLLFVSLTAIIDVVFAFCTVWRDNNIGHDASRAGHVRRRRICLLLALAAVSFVVVNGLKFEHRKLKLGAWRDLADWMGELRRRVARKVEQHTHKLEDMPNGLPGRAYAPDIHFDDLIPSKATLRKWLDSVTGMEEEALQYMRDKLPFFEHDWLRSQSLWDHFKMLAANPRRFWWLQQWLMGWVGWAVFVGVECQSRDVPVSQMMAFIILSYLAGLATVQCLFFALLLMKPPKTRRRVPRVLRPVVAMGLSVMETAQIAALPFLLRDIFEPTKYRIFDLVQLLIVVQPFAALLLLECFPDILTRRMARHGTPKRALTYVSSASCLLAIALHWFSTYQALSGTKMQRNLVSHVLGLWGGTESKVRWHADEIKNNWLSIFGVLGEHHYINALGFDVLFSAVALGCWSVIGSLDAGSMLECSFCPLSQAADGVKNAETAVAQRRSSRHRSHEASYAPLRPYEDEIVVRRRHSTHPARLNGSSHALVDEEANDDWDSEYQPPKARRGRPPKGAARSRSTSRARSVSTKRPQRFRKESRLSVSPATRNFPESGRGSSRSRKFVPDGSAGRYEGWQSLKPTVEAVAAEGESAAVALGLFVVGGLGAASSAVFGAEELR